MEANNEAEMSAQDKPKPKPRTINKDYIHSKREGEWMKEKDKLLGKINDLETSLKQKDEELQEQNDKHEVINTLENEKTAIQIKHEELETRNAELVAEKERACEIIKEFQKKSKETTEESQTRIEELENEADNLRKSLDEKNDSCNKALERIKFYENKESENEQNIPRLEEELATIRQQNDLGSRKIDELESINMEIQEARAKLEDALTKQKETYAELSDINNDMEKELHEDKTKVREVTTKLQEKTEENKQILQQKAEMERQLQYTNEDVKGQMEKLKNNAREIQNEKDKLESELVTMKLDQKRLTSESTSHSREMQELRNKATKLNEERDFYAKKCKKLEEGIKLNADNEIKQMSLALEALNEENNVLRQRNEKLEREVGGLLNIKSDLEAKVGQSGGNLGEENGGFRREVVREEPIRQKSSDLAKVESTNTSTETDTPAYTPGKQWYDTDQGSQLLAQIYKELNSKFSLVEMSRAVSTKDISLLITTDRHQKFNVHFPRKFPFDAVRVNYGDASKEIKVPFNRNAPSELSTDFTRMLCELLYGGALRQK